jgi:succinate dehydrogenase / fumarate reductase, cytochrome b subunit
MLVRPDSATTSRRPLLPNARLKVVMALTGVVFVGYVAVHMLGNLKVYIGAEEMNTYAGFLRDLLVPLVPHEWVLWGVRAVLFACLIAHVGAAAILTARARSAGALRTGRRSRVVWWRSFTSRTMPISGVVILAFVIFHVLDLTLGTTGAAKFRHPETSGGETRYFAYENLVASFQRPAVAVFYIVAMVFLGAHILHGAWSVIHDLGMTGDRTRRVAWIAGTIVAAAVMFANLSIPLAVMVGWLG